MGNPWSKKSAKMAAAAEDTDSTDDPDSAEDTDSTNDPDSSEENVSTMDEKRIQHKPVALTFADTSNQPTEQDGEGCSYWYPSKRKTYQRHEDRDEDEKALELSRQEMQVTSVTNPTSDIIISDSEIEGDDRVQTNNGVWGGESDKDSSGLEDVGLGIHGEAQAQVSGRCDASHENSCLSGAGSSDGEDSDVNDISHEENERDVAADASGPVADDVDEEGYGDEEDSSAGSSILLQSDEEVDNISSQEITACQPPHASSSCSTQSSEKAITKVGPLEDRNAVNPEESIDIFDVTEDQDELAQELGVDSQKSYQGFEKALELSRQEMQVTSVTNPTSDIIISDSEIEGDDRVETNNGVWGGESDKDSSGLEDVGLGIHGEAQAQVSGRRDASHENSCLSGAGSSDGEDSDVTDISHKENERDMAAEASDPVADDVDEEDFGDDEVSSAGSSILLLSDEEVDNIPSQEITACQPAHASSSCPTQSSKKAIAKVGPLEDINTVTPEGSIDILDVMEDQDELAQEMYVDSQKSYQGYEKTRVKMESPQPSSPRLKVANNTRTHATIVAESASGVLPTVPNNGGRHSMSRVDQHKEAAASETVSSGIPTSRTGVLPRSGCHKPKSCNPPEPLDFSYQKKTQKKKCSHGNRYSLTEALSLTKDYLSQSTWDDGIDDQDHLELDLPIAASQAGTDDIFLGMVPGSIEGLHYHTGKVSDHEMVSLVREPLNRYLKNAMKVENAWGDQVGHIKRELAEVLSYILDNNYARIEGVVPSGNKNTHVHSMPVDISLYGPRCNQMTVLQILKGRGHTVSMVESKKSSIYNPRNALGKSVMLSETEMKNEVDTLFDNLKLTEQEPSKCIVSTMYPHQKQALHWMLARESNDKPATPSGLYHNSLTNFTSAKRPDSVRGGILADDMGLGKTLSIISLILHEFAKPEFVDLPPSLPSLPEKDEVDCNEPSTSQVKQEVEDDVVLIEDSQEFPIVSEEVIVIDDDSHSSDNDTTIVIKADSPTIPSSSNSTRVTANGRLERDQAQFEEDRLERERRVSALMEEKRDLEAQKQNVAREIDQFAVNSAREQNYGLQSKDSELTQAVTAGKRRLENLEGSSKKRLKLYADYMPNLLAEIDRCTANNQFHQKPLGPVGSFLKLKDVRWALGVESCLKRLIYSFRCHDQHDASILKDIMNRLIPQNATQPSIITSKFEANRYDIRSSSVQSNDFPGFLDIVDVSNSVIFNTLVNQRGVESILLIEKLSKDVRNSLRQPPKNCREAFTLEGDQVYAGAEQRYYTSMQKSAKILRGDTDNEIRDQAQFEEERLEKERQVSALMEEKRDLEAQKQNAAREIDQFAVNSAREQNYGLQSTDSELTPAVTAEKRRLDNLEGSRKKRLKLYADYMPNLLAEIDRCTANNQFHQKPLGPVGSFLKLKDVRWALGVESCLKRLIYSFRCHDQHDVSILKEIMNRLIPQNATQPSIITSKFEANRYDIRSSSVQSNDFPSFLDIVDVSNPVIFNTLVNQRGVETILLIEKLSKEVRNSLRQPPRNCREAFTLEGDQVYAGAVQRYYSSMQRSPKILRGDTDNEIRASAANIKFIFNDDSDDNPSPEKKAKMKLPKMATAPKVKGPSQPVASLPGPCPPINSMVPFKLSSHWFSKPMKAEVSKPMKAEVSKPMKAEVKGHRGHGDAAKPRTTLIVCPLSVMSNWIDQLNEHVADEVQVNVCMYHGAEKKKLTVDYLKQQDVVITTYGTLAAEFKAKQEKGTLQKIEWLRIVLDEAHIIRNRRTLQAQAAIALKAQCKWALTGTPIQNSIKDLWTLVAFLGMEHEPFDPNLNRWQLRKARSIADNDSAGIGRLRKLMNTLALRRMKSQKVNGKPLVDLPARNVVLQYVDFSEDEKKVYQTYEKEGRLAVSKYFREGTVLDHYGEILVIILRLRQLCCHPALCAKAAAKLCQAIDGNERTDEEKAQLVAILVSFLSQGADEECCICLESVQDPVVTRCAHVFCQRCIEEVIISEKERACCPLCRQAISRESLVHVPKDRLDAEKGNTDREWHSSAKVDALMECLLTERAADKTTKSIVVSQFTSFLDVLVKPLTEKGFKFSRLDGSMSRIARTAAIREFSSNDPDSSQIFLLSLKAGGVGLNLTAASRLYLLDPAWNPACEEQSFDRCHRLGQTKDVTITKFLVHESIEEPMLKIQEFKRQLMKQVFGGKNQTPEERRMNRIRDVRILFGMDKTNSRKRERKM
ncbi:uncharacterized protein LOC100893394 isoform X2 [Strongylocentrotus purpuratus]|uniref:Uncharacterized protein n=1 Tax=Strongylocentrotus purpuratus TaxID=7668 RepID=A0A7M7SX06_STRPU|nr:uncharacterized protein LOC100893394 isoform X2 [Strongylocentrotus purpuratus]